MTSRVTFILILLLPTWGWSQTYPVQANLQLTPPYSTFLADYTAPGSDRLILNTFLGDLTRPDLQVRFRITIEGAGISLTTKPEFVGSPYLLQSGFPVQIFGADLAEYFFPESMNLVGITDTQLRRTGALPEGIYRFSLEVLEYNRGVQISNTASSTAWLILNDPPVINFPYRNELVKATEPQTVRFQWTPRHTGSPNAAFTTNYEFKLVEIWPENRNPNDAMLVSEPLFVTEISATSLIYGIGQPPLIPGRKYAFQVKAIAVTGIDQLDLFKNQGRSVVHAFTFGEACNPPTQIFAEALGNSKIKLEWESSSTASSVAVMYREHIPEAYFFEEDSYINAHTLYKLQQGTQYEVILKSQCGSLLSPDSEPVLISTNNDTTSFACGNLEIEFDLENKNPIEQLYSGDVIYAGDFDVKLEEVSSINGKYSGSGLASFPFLNFVTARVVFEEVTVNTDYRMIDGNITTYYNPNSSMMADLDSLGEQPFSGDDTIDNTSDEVDQPDSTTSITWLPVDSVYTNTEGQIVELSNGVETIVELEPGEERQYTDKDGNQITVTEDGISINPDGSINGGQQGPEPAAPDEFSFTIGPLVVHLNPANTPRTEEGKCYYDAVEASFELILEDQAQDIEKKIKLDGGLFTLVRDCDSGDLLSLKLDWQDDAGYDIGDIAYLGARVIEIHMEFSEDELLSGSVDLEVKNDIDVPLNAITFLRSGVSGKFGYAYDADSRDYTGKFNFAGVSNVNIDLLKADKVVASLRDGELKSDGSLKGYMDLVNPVSFKAGGIDIKITKFKSDIELDPIAGFAIASADIKYQITNLPNVYGMLKGHTTVLNDQYSTTLTSDGLNAFGMEFSDLNLALEVDKNLEFNSISGTLKATHPEFGASIDVHNFQILDEALASFTCSGTVIYNDLTISISQANYIPSRKLLELDAYVEYEENGIAVAATINDFTIDLEGNIAMGDYDVDISGVRTFGPLTVAISAAQEGQKKNRWISTTAQASFSLTLDESGENIQITRADLAFEKKKNKSQYRNISISLESANIPAANIGPLAARLSEMNIQVVHDADYITGESDDAANAGIGDGSSITLAVSLDEELNLGGFIYMNKGVSGSVKYRFLGDGLKGTFDYGTIQNINISARKGDLEIASLKDGALDDEGVLTGQLTALEGVEFPSGAATVQVERFDLQVSIPFLSGVVEAKVHLGTGLIFLKNIQGVEGQLDIGLTYDDQNNFLAVAQSSSAISAMGMELSDFKIDVSLNDALDIQLIEGQMKAQHAEFDGTVVVNEFKIASGALELFSIEGKVNYKGFFLDISKALYSDDLLTLDGKVAINATGTSAWLEVKEFTLSAVGEVTIKKVAGEFEKSPVLVKFSANLEESRFKGSFTGKLSSVGLAGKIDIGVESNMYNFAYLELTAKTNIPLGGTGLKLTKLGGQLGYNYALVYKEGTTKPTGEPQEGNYIIGLTLGVADVGNMAELTGNPIVQFGKDHLDLTLNGKLVVPRTKSVLKGDMSVHYKLPANTLSGAVKASLMVPSQSGKAFKGDFDMGFSVASSEWAVSSSQIEASLMEKIDFTGNVDLKGVTGEDKISGYLSGISTYEFTKTYEFTMLSFDIKAALDAGFNFQGKINFDDAGFDGKVSLTVYAAGDLTATSNYLGFSTTIEVSGEMIGSATFSNTSATLEGKLNVAVDVFGDEHSVDVNVIQTI